MSDAKNRNENQEKPFKFELETPIPFDPIADSKFIPSTELCKIVSEIFRGLFDDFEGTRFELNNGQIGICPLFNHGAYNPNEKNADGSDKYTLACTRQGYKESNSDLMNRLRSRDQQMKTGDRYQLTQLGKDVFSQLLMPRFYNNGKPNWNSIVVEWSEQTTRGFYTFGAMVPQYTKINFLDPGKLCGLVFGSTNPDDKNDHYEYNVNILAPVGSTFAQMPGSTPNYLLNVTRVSDNQVKQAYEKMGFGSYSNIIR